MWDGELAACGRLRLAGGSGDVVGVGPRESESEPSEEGGVVSVSLSSCNVGCNIAMLEIE